MIFFNITVLAIPLNAKLLDGKYSPISPKLAAPNNESIIFRVSDKQTNMPIIMITIRRCI